MDGMTVFDLVRAKALITHLLFMQKFSDRLARKSSEKGMQLFLKSIVCGIWVFTS